MNDSMSQRTVRPALAGLVVCLALMACANGESSPDQAQSAPAAEGERGTSIFDLLQPKDDPRVTVAVNKYIWHASLEVLSFLPVSSADPFSGLIVTGYGTPPGGRTAYRATILVNDPALDARSLNLSLMTRAGPVDDSTRAAVEDAILTRARQLRVADLDL